MPKTCKIILQNIETFLQPSSPYSNVVRARKIQIHFNQIIELYNSASVILNTAQLKFVTIVDDTNLYISKTNYSHRQIACSENRGCTLCYYLQAIHLHDIYLYIFLLKRAPRYGCIIIGLVDRILLGCENFCNFNRYQKEPKN